MIDAIRRSVLLRSAIRTAIAVVVLAAPTASADLDHYPISGTITRTKLGILFPGKSVGETFQGSFTIDTNAMLQSTGNGGTLGNYTGAFAVVIEGISYPVSVLSVWSSGPAGIDDGFELSFSGGSALIGFLSLRSHQELYAVPMVPTMVDLMQMDALARVSLLGSSPLFESDTGEIEFLPEAGSSLSCLAALAALAATAPPSSAWRCRGS